MAFSYVQATGDGVNNAYTFSFTGQDQGYLRESDIEVTVDEAPASFTLLSSNSLELGIVPDEGSTIIIRRVMPKDETYADFKSGNNFGQEVLNNSFLQLLYVVHELLDGWFPEGFTVREAVDYLEGLRSLAPDPSDPDSVVTFGTGDTRYINVDGDSMQGPLVVREAQLDSEPARKVELDSEILARQSADSNFQNQLTGNVPLESSAFSPISWHDQEISSSVIIPEGKNAWSFGPTVSIASGQSVSISTGSYWTVSDGQALESGTIQNYDEGVL